MKKEMIKKVICCVVLVLVLCVGLSACTSDDDIRQQGYNEGYEKGYIKAKQDFIKWAEKEDIADDAYEYFAFINADPEKENSQLSVKYTYDGLVYKGNWDSFQAFTTKRNVQSIVESIKNKKVDDSDHDYDIKAKYEW